MNDFSHIPDDKQVTLTGADFKRLVDGHNRGIDMGASEPAVQLFGEARAFHARIKQALPAMNYPELAALWAAIDELNRAVSEVHSTKFREYHGIPNDLTDEPTT